MIILDSGKPSGKIRETGHDGSDLRAGGVSTRNHILSRIHSLGGVQAQQGAPIAGIGVVAVGNTGLEPVVFVFPPYVFWQTE